MKIAREIRHLRGQPLQILMPGQRPPVGRHGFKKHWRHCPTKKTGPARATPFKCSNDELLHELHNICRFFPLGNALTFLRYGVTFVKGVKGVKPYICLFLHLPPCFFCGRIDGCHVKGSKGSNHQRGQTIYLPVFCTCHHAFFTGGLTDATSNTHGVSRSGLSRPEPGRPQRSDLPG